MGWVAGLSVLSVNHYLLLLLIGTYICDGMGWSDGIGNGATEMGGIDLDLGLLTFTYMLTYICWAGMRGAEKEEWEGRRLCFDSV